MPTYTTSRCKLQCKQVVNLTHERSAVFSMPDVFEGDFYDYLQVSRTAGTSDIKAAYKRLTLILHPDKNQGCQEKATTLFKQLGQAYEILVGAGKRKVYDAQLATPQPKPQTDTTSPFWKPSYKQRTRPFTYEDQHPPEGCPPRWTKPKPKRLKLEERFPRCTNKHMELQLMRLLELRQRYYASVDVIRGRELDMLVPGLVYQVVTVVIREEQAAQPHVCRKCPPWCTMTTDWTPIVHIHGDGADVHLDSKWRLFDNVHQAHDLAKRCVL